VRQPANSIRHTPRAKASRPAKRAPAKRKSTKPAIAFRLTGEARQIAALVRQSQAEERKGAGGAMLGYQNRRQFDQRLTRLADRIAGKPRALRDDLLTLAIAGWYATGARDTLVKAILRASGLNPQAPHLKVGPRR
jgi:hypothetical protein